MTENVLTIAGLAVFLVGAYLVGRALNEFKNRQFTRAWRPLVPVIGGIVHHDRGGGGATSWLAGSWKGRTIHARMAPDVRSHDWQHHANRFAVGVADLAGAHDWSVTQSGLSAGGPLTIRSENLVVAERLLQSGALGLVEQAGRPSVEFKAHQGALFMEEDVRPDWVPSEARFRLLLDMAVALADAHDSANR